MIDKAIAMAVKAHKGQVDKAGRPYILHPLRVAFKFTGDDEMYAAAVLHDVVEDSSVTIDNIFKAFSPYVAQIVDSLTRREGEVYLTEFIPRCKLNQAAAVIKIADIEDNLNPQRMLALSKEDLGRVKRYNQALKILRG
jgi:(p)ppGpp synthase/HD superfamily hydrolase